MYIRLHRLRNRIFNICIFIVPKRSCIFNSCNCRPSPCILQVDNTNSVKGKLRVVNKRRGRKRPHNTDLVFYEKSPNFCERDVSVDSSGTSGRFCNRTSDNIDNCETLCCGRGYSTLKVRRVVRCYCRFHWCCYVTCKKCMYDDWVTVCK